MTENKQIEEITKVLCADYGNCEGCPFAVCFADYSTCNAKEQAERIVTDKGYRKVERGEWIEQVKVARQSNLKPLYYYQCSLCRVYLTKRANYCPNCGADMRGRKNEDTERA